MLGEILGVLKYEIENLKFPFLEKIISSQNSLQKDYTKNNNVNRLLKNAQLNGSSDQYTHCSRINLWFRKSLSKLHGNMWDKESWVAFIFLPVLLLATPRERTQRRTALWPDPVLIADVPNASSWPIWQLLHFQNESQQHILRQTWSWNYGHTFPSTGSQMDIQLSQKKTDFNIRLKTQPFFVISRAAFVICIHSDTHSL